MSNETNPLFEISIKGHEKDLKDSFSPVTKLQFEVKFKGELLALSKFIYEFHKEALNAAEHWCDCFMALFKMNPEYFNYKS